MNALRYGCFESKFRIQIDSQDLMLLEQTQMRTSQEKTHISYRCCPCLSMSLQRVLRKRISMLE